MLSRRHAKAYSRVRRIKVNLANARGGGGGGGTGGK